MSDEENQVKDSANIKTTTEDELAEGSDLNGVESDQSNSNSDESEIGSFDKKQLQPVYDIPVDITVVLGKTKMTINQMLKLAKGSVVELYKNVGEPIDVLVNGKKVARGEVVIVDDKIGITLTEITKDKNE